jgi:hypothetical protein
MLACRTWVNSRLNLQNFINPKLGVVPNHKEVKIGTVNGVLRQAGVSAQEFAKAL